MKQCNLENNELSAYKCMDALGCEFLHPGGRYATAKLIEILNLASDDKVLEVGCGTGNTAVFIHTLTGAKVHGIDIDEEMITKTVKTASPYLDKLKFKIGSGENIPFEDNSFDVVISEGTTFFMDAKKALKEYCRVLKPGGRLGMVEVSYFKLPTAELENLTSEVTRCYGMKPLLFDEWENQIKHIGFNLDSVNRKSMNMNMKTMIQSEGFLNSIKMFINMMIKPKASKRMMQIMKHYNKYHDYFGYGIYTAHKQK